MDIHESTEWTSHQQRLTEVLGARKGLRDEKQVFRSISYCQRGADLFLSSRSSVRQVSGPPICGFGCCCFMQSFYYSLFSPRWTSFISVSLVKKKNEKDSIIPEKSLCSSVCLAACFAHAHCITWCSSAFAFFFCIQWQLFSSCSRFREWIKEHKHARKDCCFYTFRSW